MFILINEIKTLKLSILPNTGIGILFVVVNNELTKWKYLQGLGNQFAVLVFSPHQCYKLMYGVNYSHDVMETLIRQWN